ncbi:G patch domain-containing protein 4 [Denticeps clupeoides]|uniref:G patch domain-containing protein 4 n=1 Tax=Denticeps clupeoides TaxID=299321 RepID=A0AAY4DRD4_9TELE|nr:G patch domain-containing protein 4 [Denticeps clupeoides]
MADGVQKESRGLKFAEQQLLRHGWEKGKGLGRDENGISEAIKVKVKCDKGGVGHHQGEQFTFHWWDHVFNKASSNLSVESEPDGVKLKKVATEENEDGMISNKKPRKAKLAKSMLYGCFVKSATLVSGHEQPQQKAESSDDSSDSEDEDQRLDLSTTTKLSDSDLVKACGGRTAHKGARHGLTMSAKLARLEQQEQDFMAKYGNKPGDGHHTTENTMVKKKRRDSKERIVPLVNVEEDCAILSNGDDLERTCKKKKKKKKSKKCRESTLPAAEEMQEAHVKDKDADDLGSKKKHLKKKLDGNLVNDHETENCEDTVQMTEHKDIQPACVNVNSKKTKKKKSLENINDLPPPEEKGRLNESQDEITDKKVKSKKRKRCKEDRNTVEEASSTEKKKSKRKAALHFE